MAVEAEYFQQLAELLPFGMCLVDQERRILFWNARAVEISGYPAYELVGRQYRDGLFTSGPSDDQDLPLLAFEHAMREGGQSDALRLLHHRKGHSLPVRVKAIPIRDDHGHVVALAEVFQEEPAGAEGLCWITQNGAHSDTALGVPSFATTREQLELSLATHPSDLGVLLVEVEHLQDFARTRGREMVSAVLRAVAQTLVHAIPVPHFLGAWSSGKFLVLVPNSTLASNASLASRLATLGNGCAITWWGDEVVPHICVRSTMLECSDGSDALLTRLENSRSHAATAGEL
jgi:PAS domain S-box-containing protein